jgi:hypothetical protein
MKEKEVTAILYQTLESAGRIETKIINDVNYCIFKNANTEEYMVCKLGQELNNSHSDVLTTITDCYDWINVN